MHLQSAMSSHVDIKWSISMLFLMHLIHEISRQKVLKQTYAISVSWTVQPKVSKKQTRLKIRHVRNNTSVFVECYNALSQTFFFWKMETSAGGRCAFILCGGSLETRQNSPGHKFWWVQSWECWTWTRVNIDHRICILSLSLLPLLPLLSLPPSLDQKSSAAFPYPHPPSPRVSQSLHCIICSFCSNMAADIGFGNDKIFFLKKR